MPAHMIPNHIQIQPAILEQDINEIQRKINLVKGLCTEVHLDIMDGDFVPNVTVNDPQLISALDWGDLKVSLHLMIAHPDLHVRRWNLPNISSMIIHKEAANNVGECLRLVHQLDKQVALAINPHTSTYEITDYLDQLDAVMVMGVEPGWSAQAFNYDIIEKIKYLRNLKPNLTIMVDGGVNGSTKHDILKAGANVLCANSYIFQAANMTTAIKDLQTL